MGAPAVSSRGRRRELQELERRCDSHPVTCGCNDCLRIIVLSGEVSQEDPDSMEDEEKPYWWNR